MRQPYDAADPDSAATCFVPADHALIRIPLFPRRRAAESLPDPAAGTEPEDPHRLLRRLYADPRFREAVRLSSSSLADRLDGVLDGERLDDATARRTVRATLSYFLRACSRSTPFGLLAGVGPVRFDDEIRVRVGERHQRRIAPDAGWTRAVVRQLEPRPDVLARLMVVLDGRCRTRGDRLVVPAAAEPAERSFRLTSALQLVVDRARSPVSATALAAGLAAEMGGGTQRALGYLAELVSRGVLVTDLMPPASSPDPVAHVLNRLPDSGRAARLAAVSRWLASWPHTEAEEGYRELGQLYAELTDIHPVSHPLRGELLMDTDVVLPRAVATEVARAASVAWLAGRADPPDVPLSRYHDEFLERYGQGRAVPLYELLDPYAGLGPPPAPGGPRPPRSGPDPRGDVLLDLATAAVAGGRTEIELDERTVAMLAGPGPVLRPPAIDVPVQLLARSVDAVARGEFLLVVSSPRVAGPAGSTSGRFAGLLPGTTERLAGLTADLGGAAPVEITFPPSVDRAANLMLAPRTGCYEIPVGTFPRDTPLELRDLEIFSDGQRLRLLHAGLARELRPVAHHLVDLTTQAPVEARFLLELGRSGAWRPWSWGPAGRLPALPAVRTGRTVLAPATWRPGPDLADCTCSAAEWDRRFDRWRDTYSVPDVVDAGTGDERIELDLSARVHRDLLHTLLRRERRTNLTALPDARSGGGGSPADQDGWLAGRRSELVLALLPAAPSPRPAPPLPRRSRDGAEDWLFVAVRCTPTHELEILLEHLPALVRALPALVDRWFFVRYRHPHPHLRLRFHVAASDRRELSRQVLPLIHDWTRTLRVLRLAGPMTVHDHDPEIERYGGQQATAAVEQLFCADSVAALELLPALTSGQLGIDRAVVLAANHVDLLHGLRDPALTADEPVWASPLEWPGHSGSNRRGREALTRAAVAAIDPFAVREQIRAGLGDTVAEAWHRRAPAVAAYGRELHRSDVVSAGDVARRAVLHMSANRLLGPDREVETLSYALARTAIRARTGRRQYTGAGRLSDTRRADPAPHRTKDRPRE